MKKLRIISQAHEWIQAQGLCADDGAFDHSLLQIDGSYVPALATDDYFSGAEAAEFYVEPVDGGSSEALGTCAGMQFPDGSAVWWSEDFWSFTDPHLQDVSQEWQLTES